jgi:hypothetical protein
MDSFDEFDQTTRVTETTDEETTNIQNEDLFGSEFTDNTTVATSTNPFSNVQQQPDLSWALDDVKEEIFFIINKDFFHLGCN